MARKVRQGTCGWSDVSLLKCGRFYPKSVKTTEERLGHYSRFFSCVECDTSNYAIPSPAAVERWVQRVPSGFKFHFKAFGLFTRKVAPLNTIPHGVREELPMEIVQGQSSVSWPSLPEEIQGKIWERYNLALLPAFEKGKLGIVVFQFHLGYLPTKENKNHILSCRTYLDPRYKMAVEFRCRTWLNIDNLEETSEWLRKNGIGLVVADELEQELYMSKGKKADSMLQTSGGSAVVPIVMAFGSRDFCYIRVHRRVGSRRLLDKDQIDRWAERLGSSAVQDTIKGPIFFLWGTDHEDQPIINCKNLTKEIGELAYDWQSRLPKSGLLQLCTQNSLGRGPTSSTANSVGDSCSSSQPFSTNEENESGTVGSERNPEEKSKTGGGPTSLTANSVGDSPYSSQSVLKNEENKSVTDGSEGNPDEILKNVAPNSIQHSEVSVDVKSTVPVIDSLEINSPAHSFSLKRPAFQAVSGSPRKSPKKQYSSLKVKTNLKNQPKISSFFRN